MCITTPGIVKETKKGIALINHNGIIKKAKNMSNAKEGDKVLVCQGFIIQILK